MNWLWSFIHSSSTFAVWAAIGGVVLYFSRDTILKYVGKRIEHNFDKEIEKIRSEFRKTEELIKAQAQANEARSTSVMSFVLSGSAGRQSLLDVRRLKAVETLWEHKSKLDAGKNIFQMMGAFEAVGIEKLRDDPGFIQTVEALDKNSPIERWTEDNWLPRLEAERPFLSPVTLALYQTYQSLIMITMLRLRLLKMRDAKGLESNHSVELLRAALPEYSQYIDEHGARAAYGLIGILEAKLLADTNDILAGSDVDQNKIDFATRLASKIETVRTQKEIASDMPNVHVPPAEEPKPNAPIGGRA